MSVQSVRLRAPRGTNLQKPRPLRSATEKAKIENIIGGMSSSLCKDMMNEEMVAQHTVERSTIIDNSGNRICSENDSNELISSENSVYTSSVKEENNNNLCQNSIRNNICKARRAPRSVKLDKPRPLKSSGTKTVANSEPTEYEKQLLGVIEQIEHGTLQVQDTERLRNLLTEKGREIESTNKDLIEKLFNCIQEAFSNSLEKLSLIHLIDLVSLRNRNWEPCPVSPRETKRVSWKDIEDGAVDDEDDSIRSDSSLISSFHSYETQQSTDSGYGEMEDEVLWNDEESYLKELEIELSETQHVLKETKEESKDSETTVFDSVVVQENINRPKFSRQLSGRKMNILREPLGPGGASEVRLQVERTMPSGQFTAKGRRAMFEKYFQLMHGDDSFSDDTEECARHYSKDQLLRFSESPLTRQAPDGWSYLSKVYPDICLSKVTYFHKEDLFGHQEQIGNYVRPCQNFDNKGNNANDQHNQRRFSCGFSSPFKTDNHSSGKSGNDKNVLMRRHSLGGLGTPEKGQELNISDEKISGGFGTPSSFSARNTVERESFSFSRNSCGFGTPDKSERNLTRRNSGGFGSPVTKIFNS